MEPEHIDATDEVATPVERTEKGASGRRRLPVWAWTAIGVVLGTLVLAVVFDLATSSPEFCSSCHEMEFRAGSWRESAHSVVVCVECHQEPTAWYEVPQRVADRAQLLVRDVKAHVSGDFEDPVDSPVAGAEPMTDEVCLQCHDPNRKATSGFRILIDHVEHAKRNGSCISCHVRTAHALESRGAAMSLMSQCFTCHGTPEQPDASAECGVCHPADYELLPASHAEPEWARGHGDVAQGDPKQCGMCHEQTFCDDCHGIAMPHPDDWASGPDGHGSVAERDQQVCEGCHGSGPDLCTMCHHTSYDPMQGTWIDQHPAEVRDEGAAYCTECHPGPYCSYCHTQLVIDTAP